MLTGTQNVPLLISFAPEYYCPSDNNSRISFFPMRYRVHCDGASRGNPGESAAGVVMYDLYGTIAGRIAVRLGILTNNQAEYRAVLAGMRLVEQLNPTEVEFRLDSQLTVRQLAGEWKIKNGVLRELSLQIHKAEPPGATVRYVHVNRSENAQADLLANWALDHTSPENVFPIG